jgi:hypothetical protein
MLILKERGPKIRDAETWISAVSASIWAASAGRIDRFSRG